MSFLVHRRRTIPLVQELGRTFMGSEKNFERRVLGSDRRGQLQREWGIYEVQRRSRPTRVRDLRGPEWLMHEKSEPFVEAQIGYAR